MKLNNQILFLFLAYFVLPSRQTPMILGKTLNKQINPEKYNTKSVFRKLTNLNLPTGMDENT